MTAAQPKKRPLARDGESLRDDRLFIIACDDTFAPKQYFGFFRLPRIQVHVVPTLDGTSSAGHVLDRLLEFSHEPDDERWLLLDVDHCLQGSHVVSFMDTLRRARHNDVNIALSNPCFELWLLLHHVSELACAALTNAAEVLSTLRAVLGTYNKTRLLADQFPLTLVLNACSRAQALEQPGWGDVPNGIATRVHRLWHAILSSAHPSQLPAELRDFKM